MIRDLDRGPKPIDDPRGHASGTNSDRILLFGSGTAVGWGVLSNSLALPGALARALTAETGRGTDVDVISASNLTAANAAAHLRNVVLERFDAVVLTLGLNEVTQFASTASWRRNLDRLLTVLRRDLHPSARIYMLGVHVPTVITPFDDAVAPFLASQRAAINAITAALCAQSNRAVFCNFGPSREGLTARTRTAADYRAAAGLLAATIAPGLDRRRAAVGRSRGIRDEALRQATVDSLALRNPNTDERFDHIVRLAKSAFGTASAALTIIDHDRQWVKSSVGMVENEVPRGLSICATTIEQAGELIVSDIGKDRRFVDARHMRGDRPVRFYAGYPIEAPNGERIGALCVFDPEARDPNDVDRVLLRDLALMVQEELWQTTRD